MTLRIRWLYSVFRGEEGKERGGGPLPAASLNCRKDARPPELPRLSLASRREVILIVSPHNTLNRGSRSTKRRLGGELSRGNNGRY